ncbi:saccharopine dehydrogenase NADP-binding domain-containing protein [Arthrobacter sp. TMN-49]
MIYGCGTAGARIAALAADAGLDVLLAGRPSARLTAEADRLKIQWRSSELTDPAGLDAMLGGVQLVINTAGPFVDTATSLIRACLRNGCHYVDISNEAASFQQAWSLDSAARTAGVAVVPGAGFGTAVTESLAAHVITRIHEADALVIVRSSHNGESTPGVKKTSLAVLAQPGGSVEDGRWSDRRNKMAHFELPWGRQTGIPVAVGDPFAVAHATGLKRVTAYYSTGMNPLLARFAIPLARRAIRAGLLGQSRTASAATPRPSGGKGLACTRIWMRVSNSGGEVATSYLQAGGGGELAATIALLAAQQLLRGAEPGVSTAGQLLGSANVLNQPGLEICDL